jgi:hypothetical protein
VNEIIIRILNRINYKFDYTMQGHQDQDQMDENTANSNRKDILKSQKSRDNAADTTMGSSHLETNNDGSKPEQTEPTGDEMPNQVEELAQWYLDKSFIDFKRMHGQNDIVLGLPEEERDAYVQARFDKLFTMNMKEVNQTRLDGKALMLVNGDFLNALENNFLRAYISLERIDFQKSASPGQLDVTKSKSNEILVKILRALYICVSLRPDYIADQ